MWLVLGENLSLWRALGLGTVCSSPHKHFQFTLGLGSVWGEPVDPEMAGQGPIMRKAKMRWRRRKEKEKTMKMMTTITTVSLFSEH